MAPSPSPVPDRDSSRPVRLSADPLSETGVLRLLNESPTPAPPTRREVPPRDPAPLIASNPCPRCGHRLAGDLTICPRCRTRLATSSREWQAVYRQAVSFLARR